MSERLFTIELPRDAVVKLEVETRAGVREKDYRMVDSGRLSPNGRIWVRLLSPGYRDTFLPGRLVCERQPDGSWRPMAETLAAALAAG